MSASKIGFDSVHTPVPSVRPEREPIHGCVSTSPDKPWSAHTECQVCYASVESEVLGDYGTVEHTETCAWKYPELPSSKAYWAQRAEETSLAIYRSSKREIAELTVRIREAQSRLRDARKVLRKAQREIRGAKKKLAKRLRRHDITAKQAMEILK